jgi:hypothetical protein
MERRNRAQSRDANRGSKQPPAPASEKCSHAVNVTRGRRAAEISRAFPSENLKGEALAETNGYGVLSKCRKL